MARVSIDVRLLGGVAGAFVVVLLLAAFLLGRESTRARRSPFEAGAHGDTERTEPRSSNVPAAALARAEPDERPSGEAPPSLARDGRSSRTTTAAPPAGGTLPLARSAAATGSAAPGARAQPTGGPEVEATERAAVVAYFTRIDNIQDGPLADDDQRFASELATSALQGDTAGFERLLRNSETARRTLAAIVPPAPCASFHRRSLALLDEGIAMLRTVEKGLTRGDSAALLGVATQAGALQSRAQSLAAEADALRARYGAAPPAATRPR